MGFSGSSPYVQRFTKTADLSKYTKWKAFFTANDEVRAELWDIETSRIFQNIVISASGQRFFNTAKGFFGFGPEKCNVGGMVVVLSGGNVPYIIRPVPNMSDAIKAVANRRSDRCYTILGDSYVHGLMDGEIFELVGKDMEDIVLV